MFDIDAGHGHPLRLNAAVHPEQAVADAEREMTEATMRWIDARMRLEALQAQSKPIPVSADAQRYVCISGIKYAVHGSREERDAAFAEFDIEAASPQLTMSTDFWDHRHHVMAGPRSKIARTTGQIESPALTFRDIPVCDPQAVGKLLAKYDQAYRLGDEGTIAISSREIELLHEDDGA